MATIRNRWHEEIATDRGDGHFVKADPDETIEVTNERAEQVADDDRYWAVVALDPAPAEPPAEVTPPAEPAA